MFSLMQGVLINQRHKIPHHVWYLQHHGTSNKIIEPNKVGHQEIVKNNMQRLYIKD